MRVREILDSKGCEVVTTRADTSVAALARLLVARNIGSAIVVQGDEIVGVVSERDIVRALATDGEVLGSCVADILANEVVFCAPDDTVLEVMAIMTSRRVRHIPVIDHGRLAGVVSIGDVVKYRLDEIAAEADMLRDYVSAR